MSRVHLIGINHKTAPLAVREKLSFSRDSIGEALARLREDAPESEWILLSTCNRTELYRGGMRENAHIDVRAMAQHLARLKGLTIDQFLDFVYFQSGKDAIRHLYVVAASLDSMVLGETQILSQVKDAYLLAVARKTVGKTLNIVFQSALKLAKEIHTGTDISKGQISIASTAVSLVAKIFRNFSTKTVLVIGGGDTAELTLKHLESRGIGDILVANRTKERAEDLAGKFAGRAVDFDALREYLHEADVLISSTASPGHIIDKTMAEDALQRRDFRPAIWIDLAVPRDIDPAVTSLHGVYHYNIDELQKVIDEISEAKKQERKKCLEKIEHAMQAFRFDHLNESFDLAVTRIRQHFQRITDEQLQWLKPKLRNVSEEDLRRIEQMSHRTLNKIIHHHIHLLRREMLSGDGLHAIEMMSKLIDEDPRRQ